MKNFNHVSREKRIYTAPSTNIYKHGQPYFYYKPIHHFLVYFKAIPVISILIVKTSVHIFIYTIIPLTIMTSKMINNFLNVI